MIEPTYYVAHPDGTYSPVDMALHDSKVLDKAVETIMAKLCFCHGELCIAGHRHGTGSADTSTGDEVECGPPAGLSPHDEQAFRFVLGVSKAEGVLP